MEEVPETVELTMLETAELMMEMAPQLKLPRKEFSGCRAGAASGTTVPAPSRPYRAFQCCGGAVTVYR